MKAQQWDALVARIEKRLIHCRTIGFNDAQTANELAHTACAFLETLPPWAPGAVDPRERGELTLFREVG